MPHKGYDTAGLSLLRLMLNSFKQYQQEELAVRRSQRKVQSHLWRSLNNKVHMHMDLKTNLKCALLQIVQ